MNILFQESSKFEKDLKSFEDKDQKRIISKINLYCSSDEKTFHQNAYRPLKVLLPGDLGSSLYTLRVGKDIRVILTFEDDPIFEQTIITLLRVVRHKSLERAFKGIAESLYQGKVNFGEGNNG